MGVIRNSLFTTTLLGSLAACDNESTGFSYLEGKVISESGSVVSLRPSDEAIFGNESVKVGEPTYVIEIETSQGIYTASVSENRWSKTTLEALAKAINNGSRVKFPIKRDFEDRFREDKIGKLYIDEITVIER